jgi:dihydrofolate reductase
MRQALIVARGDNGVIGHENQLPWRLPCDLQYFKRTTLGKPIVMGRKTFESIGRPLPGRTNVVVTRNPDWTHPGVRVCQSLSDALVLADAQARMDDQDEVMIIGGAMLYREAMAGVDRLYITQVHCTPPGDATFDAPDPNTFERISTEHHAAGADYPAHTYEVWERRS